MYEHDNLIYHAATGRSWKSHKYIKKIGNKYIYKEDLENVKKKLEQGGKKVSDWNKSGKTSKYDKNISDIKKNHKKAVKARKDAAKKEAEAYSNKMSSYAKIASEKTKKNFKAKTPSTFYPVTADQKAAAKRYSAKPASASTAAAKRKQMRQELINKSIKGSQYAEKVNQISSSRAKARKDAAKKEAKEAEAYSNKMRSYAKIASEKTKKNFKAKAPSTVTADQKAAAKRYAEKVNQISSSRAKKKKKKNNNVVLPAGYNTDYRNAANKAYE